MATRFSNEEGSHASSLGLFIAGDPYQGAWIFTAAAARARRKRPRRSTAPSSCIRAGRGRPLSPRAGRLGLSWGCPALRPAIATKVIDTIKSGSLVFAYFPDQDWLAGSKYLGSCAAAVGTK